MRNNQFYCSLFFVLLIICETTFSQISSYKVDAETCRNMAAKYPKECQVIIDKILNRAKYYDCLSTSVNGCGEIPEEAQESDYSPCCVKALKAMGLSKDPDNLASKCTQSVNASGNKGLSYTEGDRQFDQEILKVIEAGESLNYFLTANENDLARKLMKMYDPKYFEARDKQLQLSKEQTEKIKQELMKRLATNSWNLDEAQSNSQNSSIQNQNSNSSAVLQPHDIAYTKNGYYEIYYTSFPNISYYISYPKNGNKEMYYVNTLTNERLSVEDMNVLEYEYGKNINLLNSLPVRDELYDKNNSNPEFDPWKNNYKSSGNNEGNVNDNTSQLQNESGNDNNTGKNQIYQTPSAKDESINSNYTSATVNQSASNTKQNNSGPYDANSKDNSVYGNSEQNHDFDTRREYLPGESKKNNKSKPFDFGGSVENLDIANNVSEIIFPPEAHEALDKSKFVKFREQLLK
ncbi:MAG: hypothetical protein IPP27_02260 [Bacteroidetes bacterium]|nr:hypothetical protein [Bacteroidota bacterium]